MQVCDKLWILRKFELYILHITEGLELEEMLKIEILANDNKYVFSRYKRIIKFTLKL